MEIDYKAASFWWSVFQWFCMLAMGVWVYLRTKDSDNAKAISALSERLDAHIEQSNQRGHNLDKRQERIEEQLKHMPSSEELAQLGGEVQAIGEKVNGIQDLLTRVEHQTSLIQEHLLRGPR